MCTVCRAHPDCRQCCCCGGPWRTHAVTIAVAAAGMLFVSVQVQQHVSQRTRATGAAERYHLGSVRYLALDLLCLWPLHVMLHSPPSRSGAYKADHVEQSKQQVANGSWHCPCCGNQDTQLESKQAVHLGCATLCEALRGISFTTSLVPP